MRSVYLKADEAPRHPRIFRKRIRNADPGIAPGEVVAVRTARGEFVGRAFFHARAPIAARILDRIEGGPPVDEEWFFARIRGATALRRDLLRLDGVTDAYRVVHAEGDGLSALVVDRYADAAVIEVGSRGMFEHLEELENAVRRAVGARRIVVRSLGRAEQTEGYRVLDRRAKQVAVTIREHGLRFRVDCTAGHKTGFFIDQRDARQAVAALARGRRVLDLCCYTGGFSLAALRGGARAAAGVDLDECAVALARENATLNGLDAHFEHADAFEVLRSKPKTDLIVLDPPKLATRREELEKGRRKSIDFNRYALAALGTKGLLFTFCCTGLFSPEEFRSQIREGARRAGRRARMLATFGQPPDHPVALDCPETRYLTGALVEVTG